LELNFLTAELRDICEDRAVAIQKLGPVLGVQLGARLADIEAVDTLDELSALHAADFDEVEAEEYRLRVAPETALALQPGGAKPPRHEDGRIDWSRLDRLSVIGIEASNG
jgi:hypothetical protein